MTGPPGPGPLIQLTAIPFLSGFLKADGQKHVLALRVKGIDVGLYRIHTLFFRQLQHIQNAPPPDVPVLIGFADNDANLSVVTKGDVSHKDALVFYVITISVGAQEVIHPAQQFRCIDMVDVVHLFAHIRVLIPRKSHLFIWIIGHQDKLPVNDPLFHDCLRLSSCGLPLVRAYSITHLQRCATKTAGGGSGFSCVPIYKIEHMCYIVYANTCLVL